MSSAATVAHSSEIPSTPMPAISLAWEFIGPMTAEAYLAKNFERNRKIKDTTITRLTEALEGGYFYPVHQGIAFDKSDTLIDGQNRLTAIAESGIGAWLVVARGVDRAHAEAIDMGSKRTAADAIRITTEMDADHKDVAIARAMAFGLSPRDSRLTLDGKPLRDFVERHETAIAFTRSHGDRKGMSANIRAIVAKAYYYENHEKLSRFMQVMASGVPKCAIESVPCRLLAISSSGSFNKGTQCEELARKTVSCVQAYVRGTVIDKVYAATIDPWPLPTL